MKKAISLFLALMLSFCCVISGMAEAGNRVIRVSGQATVTLSADTATLQIGVNTRKSTVQEAQAENNLLMRGVIDAILVAGIEEKDIITSQFDVYSSFEYSVDEQGKEISIPGYQVSNMLSVTVRDLNHLGKVLDVAMAAGANTTYGIHFSSTQENAAYQKALARAVEDAENKARVLAAAAGKELGELILMDASQQNSYYGISNTFDAKSASGVSSVVSGDVSVSATVIMEYTFR